MPRNLRVYPFNCGSCQNCGKDIIAPNAGFVKPNRKFCSYTCRTIWRNKNIPQTVKQKKLAADRLRLRAKGIKWTIERRLKLSSAIAGQNHHNWQGGKTNANRKLRNSWLTKEWRKAIYERDDYICQICGNRGGKLNADHIKPWAYFPELRFELSNGRTLCLECHKKTDTFAHKAIKFLTQ